MTTTGRVDAEMVSVVISAYNSESYLEDAITSVLEQDWEPIELIVVDDGSTDNTVAVASRFGSRVRTIHGSDDGLAATRNRGTAASNGEYLVHLDADDVLLRDAIRTLMVAVTSQPPCHIAAGKFACFVSPELSDDVASRFRVPTAPQHGHLSGVAIVRADVFDRVGPFDESYKPASDLQWWLRAREHDIGIRMIDDVVLHRRIHDSNSSLRESAAHKEVSLRLAREVLRRKRSITS